MNKVFLRTPFNYNADEVSLETAHVPEGESLAQQQFRDECDINTIMRVFGVTGQLPEGIRMPEYGDFTEISDYHSAMNATRDAEENFMMLPAEVRKRFDNNPGNFVDFCLDSSNYEEAQSLGIVPPPPVDPVIPLVRIAKDDVSTNDPA